MSRYYKLIVMLLITSLLCNGCFTPKLWERTNPDEYIQIKDTEIREEQLKSKGVKYFKDADTHSFYVEKNSFQKQMDYTSRLLGTPFTVAMDAVSILVIAIAYMIGSNELEDAKKRSQEAEITKHGYRSDQPPVIPR